MASAYVPNVSNALNAYQQVNDIRRQRTMDKETLANNALSRRVAESNLLRQGQGDARAILESLDTHAANGAAWASQDQARLPAFQAEMLKAIDQAEQTGLPAPMAEQARQRVQTITFDQLGPIAAQAMDYTKLKAPSALEQARQAVLDGTATPEQRRLAGTLAKEGEAKPVSALEKARQAVLDGTATADQRRLAGTLAKEGEGKPAGALEQARLAVLNGTATDEQRRLAGTLTAETAPKPASAIEQARLAVLNGTATAEQRRMAGTLAKEGADKPIFTAPPAGWRIVQDGDSYSMEPIPGGPADRKIKADEAKAKAKSEEKSSFLKRSGGVAFQDLNRLKTKILEAPWYDPVLGLSGAVVSKLRVPGSGRIDAEELAGAVKSNIGFDRLQQMREASPTGGALGNVSNLEVETLQKVLGSLSLAQSEEQLLDNIDRLTEIYTEILRKAQAYPNAAEFGFGGGNPLPPPNVDDLLEKYLPAR